MSVMRHLVTLIALVTAGALVSAQSAPPSKPAPPPTVAGKWVLSLEMSQGTATPSLELKQDGEKLTGTYTGRYGAFALTGTIKARAIEFGFTMSADGTDVRMTFKGEVAADAQAMKGQATLGELGDAAWSAKREKGGGN
jgi:hypothetical protein